jgi:hypothetical protein
VFSKFGKDIVRRSQLKISHLLKDTVQRKAGLGSQVLTRAAATAAAKEATSVLQQKFADDKEAKESAKIPDKSCFLVIGNMILKPTFAADMKNPKLTPELVMAVLEGWNSGSFYLLVNGQKCSGDGYDGNIKAVAAVIVQTYDYMLRMSVQYGMVSSGHVYIILHYTEVNPSTSYYSYSTPLDSSFHTTKIEHRRTAVGLVCGFAMATLNVKQHPKKWYDKHVSKLRLWKDVPYHFDVDDSVTGDASSLPDASSPYKSPREPSPSTSSRVTRQKSRTETEENCKQDSIDIKRHDDSEDEGDSHERARQPVSGAKGQKAPASRAAACEGKGKNGASSGQKKVAKQQQPRQQCASFCTQPCLLSMVRGLEVDRTCPNVRAHLPNKPKSNGRPTGHRLTIRSLVVRLAAQFAASTVKRRHRGLESMDRCGWAGALFRVTLFSRGYVFVAKGTTEPLAAVLVQEADMYGAMEHLQGETIPVLLGSMRLAHPFPLAPQVDIARLLLMSWAGEEAWRVNVDRELVRQQTASAQRQVRRAGVRQLDRDNERNILWNPRLQRVFLIDFEYAEWLPSLPAAEKMLTTHTSVKPPPSRASVTKRKGGQQPEKAATASRANGNCNFLIKPLSCC